MEGRVTESMCGLHTLRSRSDSRTLLTHCDVLSVHFSVLFCHFKRIGDWVVTVEELVKAVLHFLVLRSFRGTHLARLRPTDLQDTV